MKFRKYLAKSSVPEWGPKYFQYKVGKKKIKRLAARIEEARGNGEDVKAVKAECDREFEEFLLEQKSTIKSFYQSELSRFSTALEFLEGTGQRTRNAPRAKRQSGDIMEDTPLLALESQQKDEHGQRAHKLPKLTRQLTQGFKRILPDEPNSGPNIKKGDFRELYAGMFALKNYGILNNQAFHKIGKKYDKQLFCLACGDDGVVQKVRSRKWSEEWVVNNVGMENFYTHYDIEDFIHRLELAFAKAFYGGKRSLAIAKLRPGKERAAVIPYVWTGFSLGVSGVLLLMVGRLLYGDTNSSIGEGRMHGFYLPLYRLFFMPMIMLWGGVLDMYVWEKYKVNYRFIMELDTRNDYGWHNVASATGLVSMIVTSCLYCTVAGAAREVKLPFPPWLLFILALAAILLICINPMRMHMRHGRWVAAKVMGRILTAPLHSVGFIDFFIADQLVSLTKGLSGATITLCTLFCHPDRKWSEIDPWCANVNRYLGPLIGLLPLWFRLAQCLRRYVQSGYTLKTQAVNAGKYFASMVAVVVAAAGTLCQGKGMCSTIALSASATAHLVATLYSTAWDLRMDWGLLQSKGFPLRARLIYPKWWYYVAALINVALRFTWVVSLTVENTTGWWSNEAALMGMAFLEMYRRTQWNIFRVENEQVNNLENYRAFKDVVIPTHTEDSDDETIGNVPRKVSSAIMPEGPPSVLAEVPYSPTAEVRYRKPSSSGDYRRLSDLDL